MAIHRWGEVTPGWSIHSRWQFHNSSKWAAGLFALMTFILSLCDKHTHNEQLNVIYLHVIKDARPALQLPKLNHPRPHLLVHQNQNWASYLRQPTTVEVGEESPPKEQFWTNKFTMPQPNMYVWWSGRISLYKLIFNVCFWRYISCSQKSGHTILIIIIRSLLIYNNISSHLHLCLGISSTSSRTLVSI